MPIAKEGRPWVWGSLATGLALAAAGGRNLRKAGLGVLGVTAGLAWFFRDPDREPLPIEEGILAPADGRVIRIDTMELPELADVVSGPQRRVSIFMNLTDCHVNRAPVSGTVIYKKPDGEECLPAWEEEASERNRRVTTVIEGNPTVVVRQVAGLVARQVVTRVQVGERVEQGDRIGIIMFGSRVDVFFPPELELMINVGDRTVAGLTALARIRRLTTSA